MYGLYLMWDNRGKDFGSIMTLKNDSVAKRVYLTSVNKWPDFEDDFKLYKVGEYDPENLGRPIHIFPSPVFIDCTSVED